MKKQLVSFYLSVARFILSIPYSLFFISYFLLPTSLSAQRKNFQTYSLEEGLPQATIYCIIQDKRGYIWLGTDGGGLCRFDGVNFKTYGKKEGFEGRNIRSLLQDSQGRIWAGTKDEGIIIYDGKKFIPVGKKQGLAGSAILCLLEDENGIVWAGTDDGGVNKIYSEQDSFRIQVIDEAKGLSNNSVFNIHKDPKGNIWLATFGGINIITTKRDSIKIEHLRGGKEIPSDYILSIKEDSDGALWCGTLEEGVFKIDPPQASANSNIKLDVISRKLTIYDQLNGFNAKKIWSIYRTSNNELWFASVENGIVRKRAASSADHTRSKNIFENYSDDEGLPANQVLSIFEDREKNIWIGTSGSGLCKFMGDVFSHYSDRDGLPSNIVQGIDQDSTGAFWLATSGGGLAKLDLKSGTPVVKHFTIKDGLPGNSMLAVSTGKASHNKNIWGVFNDAGISKYNGKSFQNFSETQGLLENSAYSILVDKNGIVWVGTLDGISRFDGQKFLDISMATMGIEDKGVNAIIQDKNGNLWFGTGGGLAKYGGDGAITTYDEVEGLHHKEIKTLAEDPFGNIWIGTNSGGLYRFDMFTDNKVKIHLVANDSLLSSNSVRAIIFLDEKNSSHSGKSMLVGTDKGIDKVTFDDKGAILNIRNYNATDGFIGVECNDNAMYRDAEGMIWIGTVKGLTRFNPSAEIINKNEPQIHIANVKLFFKDVDWTSKGVDSIQAWFNLPKSLTLSYSDNHLTFDYAAISLGNPQKIKYRYMLEGAETEWSPDRKETSVTFSGLSSGTYTFKVIASGANGVWNSAPATFTFTISPPWYRSTAAIIIYLIVIVGGTYVTIKYRERALILEKKILEEKVQERTAEVVKQKEELEEQKYVIEEKNKDITDSINYAEKIQRAILPDPERIKRALPDSFILFQPRDIVSGDFFWFAEVQSVQPPNGASLLLAAADCTGHGVPGAFMSMINTSLLNESVNEKKIYQPSEILNEVRRGIIHALKQKGESGEQKDGMDVGLVKLEREGDICKMQYAAANNSLYIIRKENPTEIEQVDADPMPVAISDRTQDFTNHYLELKKGDCFYIFTDGYADQFGGPRGKKFKYSQFRTLLLSIGDKPMAEQHDILEKTMEDWKGSLEQIDDILVIGVRV